MDAFYSPLRYPGGKNCIFPFMSNLFYENQLIGIRYAEPYAGGAGLALKLLFGGYVDHIYINDLDLSIYAFWKTIIDQSDEFCKWIEDVEITVSNWNKYRIIQNHAHEVDQLDLAKSTFFLNRTNVSGVIQGGIIGGFEQTGKYKIDARFKKQDLINRIQKIANLKNRISVSNLDGLKFIKKMDSTKENIFIYLDPPYYQKGAGLYMNFYSEKDHENLARNINQLKKKWIVSYDNHAFILNLYAEQRKILHKLSQAASNRVGDELFIFSEKINFDNSMKHLKSPLLI